MRDYALNRAISTGEFGAPTFVKRLWRNWNIGVTRLDIRWAAGLPLTVNAALALEERAFRRRKDENYV
jgi:hypothetical protein